MMLAVTVLMIKDAISLQHTYDHNLICVVEKELFRIVHDSRMPSTDYRNRVRLRYSGDGKAPILTDFLKR